MNSKLNLSLDSEATKSRSRSPTKTHEQNIKLKAAPQWISHSIIRKLIDNLNIVYTKHNIPSFHKDYFNENIYTLYSSQAGTFITRELDDICNKRSKVFIISTSIEEREVLFENLSNYIDILNETKPDKLDRNTRSIVLDLFYCIRQLSIRIIQSITDWRV